MAILRVGGHLAVHAVHSNVTVQVLEMERRVGRYGDEQVAVTAKAVPHGNDVVVLGYLQAPHGSVDALHAVTRGGNACAHPGWLFDNHVRRAMRLDGDVAAQNTAIDRKSTRLNS